MITVHDAEALAVGQEITSPRGTAYIVAAVQHPEAGRTEVHLSAVASGRRRRAYLRELAKWSTKQ